MKIKLLFIVFLVGIQSVAFSQSDKEVFCHEIDNKKVVKDYDKAIELLFANKISEAEKLLNQVLLAEDEFSEAIAALAEIQYIKYEKSTDKKARDEYMSKYKVLLEKILVICPEFENYKLNFIVGKIYFKNKNHSKASKYLTTFSNNIKSGDMYDEAQKMLAQMDEYLQLIAKKVPYNPVLIQNVSSKNNEYLPFVSPDGSLMFFTRAYMKKDMSSAYLEQYVEEFTISHNLDDSGLNYGKIEAMSLPFNTGKNQGAATININNSELFMTICENSSRDYNNCDIYHSVRTHNGWSELRNLGPNINGTFTWESQPTISADGKTLYFASIRTGNVDFDPNAPTSDIWYSTKNPDGTWSKAKNLGSPINTGGNEKSPFIHSDSQTLYFSSDGHTGVGGYDIFFSKFRDNKWTVPQNIGFPINTENDDVGFVVNTSGSKAYFASNTLKGAGGWDIYSIDIYDDIKPEKVILIKGQIVDEHGYSLDNAKIDVVNVENNSVVQAVVNKNMGNYAVAVNHQKEKEEFLVVVKKEDYSFTSSLIEVTEKDIEKPIQLDFDVKPIEEGTTVQLNDIYFTTASYQISQRSFIVLNNFINFLNTNSSVKIEIRGHTDNVGSLETNLTLSKNRAKAVYDYLIQKGISRDRLQYEGYGPNDPIESNDYEAGRAKNRRTEFYIMEK